MDLANRPDKGLHDLVGAIGKLGVHDHLCLIYETREEQFSAVIPFMKIGLERGEKCLYVVDDTTAAMVINEMKGAGMDVETAIESGKLTIASKQDAYLKQGYFDPDWMVGFLKRATDEAKAAGFSALRITGEMTWVLSGDPGTERLMEYEAKLNYFFPENYALAICQYNRNRFAPEIIKNVISTHPLVICGGVVCRNFYFVPPDDFLGVEQPAREIERLLANIINMQKVEDELRRYREQLEELVRERTTELSRMNERFSLATSAARLGVWDWDIKRNELLWDDMMYELYGIKREAFASAYEAWLRGIHPDDRASSDEASKRARSGEKEYDTAFRVVWPDGTIHYLKAYGRIVRDADGAPVRMIGINFDVTVRKSMDDALYFVAQRGWLADAENFFDALARYLGENLDMDYVVIDRLDENPAIAETVALYAKGAIVPNMRYVLKGTPCENVMGRRLCVYPQGVQQLFPEDTLLAEMSVESYIGIPLWDSSGQPIGLIALMGSKPFSDAAPATQLLQLVATRAAAELARERSDRILRTREYEFRTLANSLPDNIVRYDREGRTVYVNPVLEKTLGAAAAEMIGKRVREINPDGSYEAYAQTLDAALSSGENYEFDFTLPIPGQEPIVHHIRMIAERDEHDEVTGVLAIGHDITERKRAEEALHLQTVELEKEVAERQMAQENLQEKAMLLEEEIEKRQKARVELEKLNDELEQRVMLAELSAEIGCDLTASGNLQTMLNQCSESLVRHLNVAFARIWTFNEAENVLELQASAGMYTRMDGSHSRVPFGKFKIGLIAEERKPHITNAVLGDPRVHDQEWAKREGMVAFAGHPLVVGDKLVGVMAMFSRNQLSNVTVKALESVSNEIAIGIERKRNEEALEQLNEELEQRVKQRTAELDVKNRELERFNKLFVNRELKMVELKARIRELEIRSGGKGELDAQR